jgi:hypothetical protein
MIAWIDPNEIPHQLLGTLLADEGDEMQLGEAFVKLENVSLLEVAKSDSHRSYTTHSIVLLAIQCFLSSHDKTDALNIAARNLAKCIPENGIYENWRSWSLYLLHTTTFYAAFQKR